VLYCPRSPSLFQNYKRLILISLDTFNSFCSCIRNGGDSRYAVKILSPEVINDPARYLQGIIDMAVETRFLSDIEHPNIIKMRAIAKCDTFSEEYFIGMDRLYDTLGKRIETWRSRMARTTGMVGRLNDRKGKKAAALYEERIVTAFDLAAAIDYLHKVDFSINCSFYMASLFHLSPSESCFFLYPTAVHPLP
jgi:hypothetical protein